ncbi:MAG: Rho termination factor N-terminal domain-containing protein [Planctomycetota bacterium]|jgi:hypothetical protein
MPATKVAKKPVTKKHIAKKPAAKKSSAGKRKSMGMPQIKMKAKSLGINPGTMKKPELIHSIQVAEGYSPCFGMSGGHCDYTDCCFIKDCLKN